MRLFSITAIRLFVPCAVLLGPCGCEPSSDGPTPDDSSPPDGDTDTDTDVDTDADADGDADTDTTPLVAWVVRHAEKDEGHDPHLTEEGQQRAEALVPVMADVPLVAVYATDYNRTQ